MIRRLLLFAITGLLLFSCSKQSSENSRETSIIFDLDSILVRGSIRAVTGSSFTDYFVYRGEPMGFHYELLKAFTDYLGLDLELVMEENMEEAFGMLFSGDADLLAMGLTITPGRSNRIAFTKPIDSTFQVIVQRKPNNWHNMSSKALDDQLLRRHADLSGKSIFVQKGSVHGEELRDKHGKNILPFNLIEVPFGPESLIQLVDDGEIEYAAVDESIARVYALQYSGLDIEMKLTGFQEISWAMRKDGSEQLQNEFDQWFSSFSKTAAYAVIYRKYFSNPSSGKMLNNDYYSNRGGKVSQWDELIKEHSVLINWDWRLLASLIYQESRFFPNVVSRAGAYGLMQVMPETGKNFGIDVKASPAANLRAGTRYIKWLHKIFDPLIPEEVERTKFILASYNAGPGHILDAMRLAEKNGMDPAKWVDVEKWLQKKAEPQYYNDTIVKNGFFRGRESIAFVNQILNRYEHYKNLIREN